MKEHQRAIRELDVDRSEIARHVFESDHRVDVEQVQVVDKEPQWRRRTVKEAIWTKHHGSFNKTKHSLSDQWCLSHLQTTLYALKSDFSFAFDNYLDFYLLLLTSSQYYLSSFFLYMYHDYRNPCIVSDHEMYSMHADSLQATVTLHLTMAACSG